MFDNERKISDTISEKLCCSEVPIKKQIRLKTDQVRFAAI